MGWEKIIDIFSWLKDKLPIQDRLERVKNQVEALERERNQLLQEKADVKKAKRIIDIDNQLVKLRGMLKNATDSS